MGVLETIKDVAELVQKADNIDLLRQVLNLQQDVMKLLEDNRSLKEQLRHQQERFEALQAQLQVRDQVVFHHNAFWRDLTDGALDGPYSPTHWELHHKLVRMRNYGRDSFDGVVKVRFYEPNSKDDAWIPLSFMLTRRVAGVAEE